MNIIDKITSAVSEAVEAALGVNLLDMFVQLMATLILVLIVRYFFWNKVTAFLDKRREFVDSELKNAETLSQEAQLLKETTSKEADELKKNARQILESSRHQAEEERQLIVRQAKQEAKKIQEDSKRSLDLEIEKAKAEVNNQAVELAAMMASQILEKEVNAANYQSGSSSIKQKDDSHE